MMTKTIIPEQDNVRGNYADFGEQPSAALWVFVYWNFLLMDKLYFVYNEKVSQESMHTYYIWNQ